MSAVIEGKHTRPSAREAGPLKNFWNDLADDYRRRLLVAFALAVAIHEIVAGFFTFHPTTMKTEAPEQLTIAHIVKIEHRPTPKPKVHVIAPTQIKPKIVQPAPQSQPQKIPRKASARPVAHTRYHLTPIAHIPVGGHGAGTTKATASTGGAGTGGTGTGQGGTGTGIGGGRPGQEPCGFVTFIPTGDPTIDESTGHIFEHLSMTVHFADGSIQTVDLDWPFYYRTRSADPFMPENNRDQVVFQFPPAGQRAGEPELVQYVIAHTDSGGYTKLKDCPS